MMRYRKKPVEVEAWPVRELNWAAEHAWHDLPKVVSDDYENPQGEGAWVFGALAADRHPECVELWPECESGKYDPRCCRFPKSCSCLRERRGIYVPTLEGSLFAAPDDYIIQGVQGEFYPCKPDIFEQTYEPVRDPFTMEVMDLRDPKRQAEFLAALKEQGIPYPEADGEEG